MKKRTVSVLLIVVMLCAMLPMQAFAAPDDAAKTPFTDVLETDWFYDPVLYASQNGFFNGTSATTFDPGGTMTRGMFVTVLGRMAGVDASVYSGASVFSDVSADSYYAPYVTWAAKYAITNGTGGGLFDPNGIITRQQMATFFMRYLEIFDVDFATDADITTTPADINTVADYAKDAVLKLWLTGILNGDGVNFNPNGNATRAETATLCMRADQVVSLWYSEPGVPGNRKNNESDKPAAPGYDMPQYSITFDSNGGSEIAGKSLISGAFMSGLPVPFKAGHVFLGWCYDEALNELVAITDKISGSLTLYALYQEIDPTAAISSIPYVTELDVATGFEIIVNSINEGLNVNEVKAQITAKNLSKNGDTESDKNIVTITGSGGSYTISGTEGFIPGHTYKITLDDAGLTFNGQDASIREFNFTVANANEGMSLSLVGGIKQVSSSRIGNVTQDGAEVGTMSVSLMTVSDTGTKTADMMTGTFTYSGNDIKVGDTVAVYDGLSPDERIDAASSEDKNAPISYINITAIDNGVYSYESARVEDVLFTPDVLPVNQNADTDGCDDNNAMTVPVSAMTYTDTKYSEMGLDSQTTIDVGDFIAFYSGVVYDDGSAELIGYAQITSVEIEDGNYVIEYIEADAAAVLAAMGVFETDEISGDMLLDGVNKDELEAEIVQAAIASGFVDEASQYLTTMALATDSFTQLSDDFNMTEFSVMNQSGGAMSQPMIMAAAANGPSVEITKKDVKAQIGTSLQHFRGLSGVRAVLTISIEITIHAKDGVDIVINVTGKFEQELRVTINVSADAVWKWKWIFPYISDFHAAVSVDIYTYTGISIKATITTSNGEPEDISEQMKVLLDNGGDESVANTLQARYKEMLETKSDWVDIISQRLFTSRFSVALIFTVETTIDFVVSANMNMSLGMEFTYENAKRYVYNVWVFAGRVTSDTINLVTEKYTFEFYVMGTLGLRAGIRAEVSLSLITKGVGYISVTAEVGAYTKLYGYFYYKYTYNANNGSASNSAGVLYIEVGAYLIIKFTASALGGKYSYSPTLYENEWALWKLGTTENVTDFSYAQAKAPRVDLKGDYRSSTLPGNMFEMTGMSLTTGAIVRKTYPAGNFTIKITNPAFTFNQNTGVVTVNPGDDIPVHDGVMIITWKGAPLAFTSAPIQRTIPLHWDNLRSSGYMIAFNSNGGSAVNMITLPYGATVKAPADPVRQGYIFDGWYTNDALTQPYTFPATMPNEDTLVYAKWIAATNTPYTVEHYTQAINGSFSLEKSQPHTGTTDTTVTAARESFTGFADPVVQTVTIAADGSAIMRYYYTRNSYTVTFDSGEANVGSVTSAFKYDAVIYAPKFAAAGYAFVGWNITPDEKMPAGSLTYTAQWTPADDTPYRVEHYQQTADGTGYVLVEDGIEYDFGRTGDATVVNTRAFDHYEAGSYTPQTIAANGTTVVRVEYDRTEYTITFDLNPGEGTAVFNEDVSDTASVRHGATVQTLIATDMTRAGYAFAGWYKDTGCSELFDGKMPAEDITVYAKWEAGASAYTVFHHKENADNGEFTLADTDNRTGTSDTDIAPDVKDYTNFTAPMTQTVKINADSSTVVNYYYTRDTFALEWSFAGGIASGGYTNAGQVKHGAAITVPTLTLAENDFAGWSLETPTVMPAGNITYTALWTPWTFYSINYNLGGGTATGSNPARYSEKSEQFTLSAPIRPHYAFAGWTWEDQTNPQESVTITPGNMTGAKTFTANWTAKPYTITFRTSGAGETGTPPNNINYTADTVGNLMLPDCTFVRTGYHFDGWYTAPNGAGISISTTRVDEVNDLVPNWDGTASLTLYPKWAINVGTVKLALADADGRGDAVSLFPRDVTHGSSANNVNTANLPGFIEFRIVGDLTNKTYANLNELPIEHAKDINVYIVWKNVSGNGSNGNPYLFYTRTHLEGMDKNMTASYKLMADLDLGAKPWVPLGKDWVGYETTGEIAFNGVLDGNNKTISNMTIKPILNESFRSAGLFFWLGNTATVKNLTFDTVKFTSDENSHLFLVGTLAGRVLAPNSSEITNVHVKNLTSTLDNVSFGNINQGGLFGRLQGSGSSTHTMRLSNCSVSYSGVFNDAFGSYMGCIDGKALIYAMNCSSTGGSYPFLGSGDASGITEQALGEPLPNP